MVALMLTGKMSDEERRTTEIKPSKMENRKSRTENSAGHACGVDV